MAPETHLKASLASRHDVAQESLQTYILHHLQPEGRMWLWNVDPFVKHMSKHVALNNFPRRLGWVSYFRESCLFSNMASAGMAGSRLESVLALWSCLVAGIGCV